MAAGRGQTVHRALDGTRFALGGDLDPVGAATSVAEVVVGGRLIELTSGAPGLGAEVARASGIGGFDEELSYRDGTLRTGRAQVSDPRAGMSDDLLVAAWEGRRYSLVTHLYRSTTTQLLGLLALLGVEEHADGLAVTPAAGVSFRGPACVIHQVRGLGLLEIRTPTAEDARGLPGWAGTALGTGELFRDTLADGSPYFLLATPHTWVTVLPLADTRVEAVPALLARLRVERVG